MQNKLAERLKGSMFSVVLFFAALYLFNLAGKFDYAERSGQLGPGFWPRLLLGLIIVLTFIDLMATLFKSGNSKKPMTLDSEVRGAVSGLPGQEEKKRYPYLLIIGGLMSVAYVLLVQVIGFALCTFLYLAGFMYVGRYRRHGVIWISSLLGTLFFMFLFIKVVYVSLPMGISPFDGITLILYYLFGIS